MDISGSLVLRSLKDRLELLGGSVKSKPWEASLLGKPSWDITLKRDESELRLVLPSFVRSLCDQRATFVSCRISADFVIARQALLSAGFDLIECYLDFVLPEIGVDRHPDPSIRIRQAVESDVVVLAGIGSRSFRYSRFHTDPQIPKVVADQSRREWVVNAFHGRADYVLVVDRGRGPEGFVAARITRDEVRLDLMAVDISSQRQGLGAALVEAFLVEGASRGITTARVGTQANNVSSVRLYETKRFRLDRAYYSFHLHTGN